MISNMYFKGLITLRTGRNVGKFIVQYKFAKIQNWK